MRSCCSAHPFTPDKERFINLKQSLDTFPSSYPFFFFLFLAQNRFSVKIELQVSIGNYSFAIQLYLEAPADLGLLSAFSKICSESWSGIEFPKAAN